MSNKTVTYVDIGFRSPSIFWEEMVVPNVVDYRKYGGVRSAMQAATYAWHLTEWGLACTKSRS